MSGERDPDADDVRRGDRFKALRARQGLTQEEVAQRGGLTRTDYNKVEKGLSKFTSAEKQSALARAFGVNEVLLLEYARGRIELDTLLAQPSAPIASIALPNGLKEFLANMPNTFTAEEVSQASAFRSFDGVDLTPEQWGRYLQTQRALRATYDAEQRLRAAGVDPSVVQHKVTVRVVTDDPIEERRSARAKKRG